MQVVDERGRERVRFQDLMVGDVFYETNPEDGDAVLLMVTPIVYDTNSEVKYNCVCLENGWGWWVADNAPVEKTNAKIVLC